MLDFKLPDSFVNDYKIKPINWGPLGEFVFYRTYSRFLYEENRCETWVETVRRVVEGTFSIQKRYCKNLKLPFNTTKAQKSARIMFDKIFSFKFLPPGRGLWLMGTDFVYEKGSAGLNNCGFVSTDDLDVRGSFAFTWTMDALMLGVGVGFDTMGRGKITVKSPKTDGGDLKFTIPDSREGWVESFGLLLDGFFHGKKIPEMDYSLIRPEGSPIKGFGGAASGPAPLKKLHERTSEFLLSKVGNQLSSTDIVDLMNFVACCVIAGNIRRSAELAIGLIEDKEYVTMKQDNQLLQDRRWASNNSVFAEVGKTDYNQIISSMITNGEPGIIWIDNIRKYSRTCEPPDWKDKNAKGVNPCGEQVLESGELCCLVETMPSLAENYSDFKETLKYAYLYAKTVTLLPTHWEETNAILLKNRRIGTSQSGIVEAFQRHGRREMLRWSDQGYQYLKELDSIYSDWLCVPRSKKITSVKPSGTVSLLPGVSPGIHYQHSEYYIRRIRLATTSPLVEILKKAGYEIEPCVYSKDCDTVVISFPVCERFFTKKKKDVSIWEQIKNAVDYQRWWSDNNVSITVTFKPEEIKDIKAALDAFEDDLKCITFLPLEENSYQQMPYEEISKEQYARMASKITKPNFSILSQSGQGEKYCDSDSCEIQP